MYPSKGRFSAVVCPLSAESQCTRPYCHFKHAPRETGQAAPDTCSLDKNSSATAPVQLSSADRRLSGSSRETAPDRPKTEPTVLKSHIPAIRVPQYRPTPLAILQKRNQTSSAKPAALSTERSTKPSPYTPQYVPQLVKPVVKPPVEAKFSSDEEDDNEEEILKELFQEAEQVHALNGNEHSRRGDVIVIEDEKSHETGTEKSGVKDTKHESSHSRHGHKSKKSKSASKSDHHSEHRHSSSSHKSSKDNHRSSSSSTTASSSSRKKDKCDKSEKVSLDSSKKCSDKISAPNGTSRDEKRHKSSSSSSSKSSQKSSRSKSTHKTEMPSSKHNHSSDFSLPKDSSSRTRETLTSGKRKGVESGSSDSEDDSHSSLEDAMKENGCIPAVSKESEEEFTLTDDVIELSDEDPEAECLRVFQEGEAAPQPARPHSPEAPREPSKVIEMVGTTRKRIAHDPTLKPNVSPKKIIRPSPSQQLAMRLEAVAKLQRQKSTEFPSSTPIERKRIATVSSSLIKAVVNKNNLQHPKVTTPPAGGAKAVAAPTVQRVSMNIPKPHATNHVQTKGVNRVAHAAVVRAPANDPAAPPRPRIPFEAKAKVPANVRQMYLEKLIDANNQACTTYEESYQKSLDEERDACLRAKDKKVYLSLMANLLLKIKKQSGVIKPAATTTQTMSHADILCGPKAKKMSFSIEKNRFRTHAPKDNFTEEEFYEHLKANYLMKPEELDSMGYPRPHTLPGRALFRNEKALSAPPDPRLSHERTCSRCNKLYLVDAKGLYLEEEPCVHHWGKNWQRKVKRTNTREQQYTCCEAASGSEGCCVATGHVFENPILSEDVGYCKTLAPQPSHPKRVFALDCEMVYTTKGTELARVSVVDLNMKTVYETKVKPENPILDYNTRFSGLKEEDLKNCTTSIYDVQAVLLSKFSTDTILMGHSLESDLKALRLIHLNVVDTSLVFPHKMGLPYKRALKNLLKDYCQKIIQDGVDGHDSAEDAKACIELMIWKMKEDLKS